MAEVLKLEGVSKRYGSLSILDGLSLTVSESDRVAVLGPSGSGKSTLLHVAGLMDRPSQGEIFLNGRQVKDQDEKLRAGLRLDTIGFLFQFHYLIPDFNVLENTLLPVRLAGDDLAEGEVRAKDLLGRLGLSARLTHWPHQLSGGEQQRAALARAMILNPRLLLCDEPTGNLDAKTAAEMINFLWETARSEKTAVVMVTHNEELARQVDTSYHLVDGKLQRGS